MPFWQSSKKASIAGLPNSREKRVSVSCPQIKSPHRFLNSTAAAAVQVRTVLLPHSTCAGTRAAGLQPVSLPIRSIQMSEILHRGLLPYPSSWPGCSAVQSNYSPGLWQPCCQRSANRSQIPLQQHLAKVAPCTSTVEVRTVTAVTATGLAPQTSSLPRLPLHSAGRAPLPFIRSSNAAAVPTQSLFWHG